jgi:hypothetical protein
LLFWIDTSCDDEIVDLVFDEIFENLNGFFLAGIDFKHHSELIVALGDDHRALVTVGLDEESTNTQ